MNSRHLFLCGLMSWAVTANANPVDDVRAGVELHLGSAEVSRDGNTYGVYNHDLPKAGGTLDMRVRARDFGIDHPMELPLTGTVESGADGHQRIVWTFDAPVSPGYHLGEDFRVTRVVGTVVADARYVAGSADGLCGGLRCPYNVWIDGIAARSSVYVEGTCPWWKPHCGFTTGRFDATIPITVFRALGGVPRPRLATFDFTPAGRRCSGDRDRTVPGRVTLDAAAPSLGTSVDFASSWSRGVRAPGRIHVTAGRREGVPYFTQVAGFSGRVMLTAAAGGLTLARSVEVLPDMYCLEAPQVALLRSTAFCPTCVDIRVVTNTNTLIERVQGQDFYEDLGQSPVSVASLVGADSAEDSVLSTYRHLVGVLSMKGVRYGFYRPSPEPPGPTYTFPDFFPRAVNNWGVAVGYQEAQGARHAAFFNGKHVVALGASGASSSAVAINDNGQIAVNVNDGQLNHAARFDDGKAKFSIAAESEAKGLDADGRLVGRMRNAKGGWSAFITDPDGKQTTVLSVGTWPDSYANAVNSHGWVVGAATAGNQKTGFLYTPAKGVVDLNAHVDPKLGLTVVEGLALNDDGAIVVRALKNGVLGQYLVTP